MDFEEKDLGNGISSFLYVNKDYKGLEAVNVKSSKELDEYLKSLCIQINLPNHYKAYEKDYS